MKIEKTQGVLSSDEITCIRLQEIIFDYTQQCPISKVVIDVEKLTFYKYGLKLGIARHVANGIYYNNGNLLYEGWRIPKVEDKTLCDRLYLLFDII